MVPFRLRGRSSAAASAGGGAFETPGDVARKTTLAADELRFYNAHGFLYLPAVVDGAACDVLRQEVLDVCARDPKINLTHAQLLQVAGVRALEKKPIFHQPWRILSPPETWTSAQVHWCVVVLRAQGSARDGDMLRQSAMHTKEQLLHSLRNSPNLIDVASQASEATVCQIASTSCSDPYGLLTAALMDGARRSWWTGKPCCTTASPP
jgi:hypothetical protein